jgi:hypothetical protein
VNTRHPGLSPGTSAPGADGIQAFHDSWLKFALVPTHAGCASGSILDRCSKLHPSCPVSLAAFFPEFDGDVCLPERKNLAFALLEYS